MFTDNVITLPSSWCLDSILVKDVSPQSWKQSPEMVIEDTDFYVAEECDLDRIRQFHDYCTVGYQSSGTSIASSECSDDIYHDNEDDTGIELFGDLASSVLNIIQDIKDTESYSVLDDDSAEADGDIHVSCDNCTQTKSTDNEGPESPSSIDLSCSNCSNYSSKHRRHSRQKNRTWNTLNEEEKVAIVDQLSQRISQDLGLREQLEVIRIIDPKSRVLPTDRQFLIDIMKMSEEKIQKIQDYIKTHTCRDCQSDDSSISKSSPKRSKKKFQSQERKQRHRVDKQRQKREYKQIQKERRSGLFVKEEVLSLSRLSPPPEEEDIDILG